MQYEFIYPPLKKLTYPVTVQQNTAAPNAQRETWKNNMALCNRRKAASAGEMRRGIPLAAGKKESVRTAKLYTDEDEVERSELGNMGLGITIRASYITCFHLVQFPSFENI